MGSRIVKLELSFAGIYDESFCTFYLRVLQGHAGESFTVCIFAICASSVFVMASRKCFETAILIICLLIYRYMDYVFGNETEARAFSKVHGWEVSFSCYWL